MTSYARSTVQRLLAGGQAHSAALVSDLLLSSPTSRKTGDDGAVTLLRAEALYAVREFAGVLHVAARADDDSISVDVVVRLRRLAMRAAFELGDVAAAQAHAQVVLEHGDSVEAVCEALCCLGKCAELCDQSVRAAALYSEALQRDAYCAEAMHALVERYLLDTPALLALIDTLPLPQHAQVEEEGDDDGSTSSDDMAALRLRDSYRALALARASVHVAPPLVSLCRDGDVTHACCAHAPRRLRLLCRAQHAWSHNRLQQALHDVNEALAYDDSDGDVAAGQRAASPSLSLCAREAVCVQLAILIDVKATPLLYDAARTLAQPQCAQSELAVYAIGCFYYAISNYERAGRYFGRATELDRYFVEAWVAYGHCYARLEEGEQALGVYRTCLTRFPGATVCGVYVAMQHSRVHQWPIALSFLQDVLRASPQHVLALNEMGVLCARMGRLHEAMHYLARARDALPCRDAPCEYHDCVVFNLATVLRKLGMYADAIAHYTRYVHCRPHASHAHCALGFAHHLAGELHSAIAHYQRADSLKPDAFCRELLERALASSAQLGIGSAGDGVPQQHGNSAAAHDVVWAAAVARVSPHAV